MISSVLSYSGWKDQAAAAAFVKDKVKSTVIGIGRNSAINPFLYGLYQILAFPEEGTLRAEFFLLQILTCFSRSMISSSFSYGHLRRGGPAQPGTYCT